MLVLSRKEGQAIVIDKTINITVNRIHGNRVELGISAPKEAKILRGELQDKEERKPS
jgi:carbon storage regulator CsrA